MPLVNPADTLDSAANISFVPSGTGAITTDTVQAALRRLVHTAQYSSQANYETARDALTGTIGVQNLDVAGTLTFPALPGPSRTIVWETSNALAADFAAVQFNSTFSTTVDSCLVIGYNLTAGGARQDETEPSIGMQIEHDFNTGSAHLMEWIVGGVHADGVLHRPLAFGLNRSTKTIDGTISASTLRIMDSTLVNAIVNITNTTTTAEIVLNQGTLLKHGVNNVPWLYQLNNVGNSIEIARVNASDRIQIGANGSVVTIGAGNTFLLSDTGSGNAGISTTAIQTLDNAQLWLRNAAGSTIYWKMISGALTAQANYRFVHGASALATNATEGFFHLNSCAGAATGTPATIPTAQIPMVMDSTNKQLYAYIGGTWFKSAAFT